MKFVGYDGIVDIFLGHYKIGLFWGSFQYTLVFFLKVQVQNGNIFLVLQNFKYFLGYA